MGSAIARLNDFGQSPWYDNLARSLLQDGGLARLIEADGIKGVTSNPTIFEKAMAAGEGYDEQLKACGKEGLSIEDSYWRLVVDDVGTAADLLRPVYDATGGADGFVSVEVSPDLAHDTDRTIAQAKELFGRLGRPNVMIKIPATVEGLPAIQANIAAGINTNVTLIFSLARHDKVIDAYLNGARAARRRRWGPRDGLVGRVVLRQSGRHRDRPAAPREQPAARQGRRGQRQAGVPPVPAALLGEAVGRARRRRARVCSVRCGLRRRRRTRRTPPRSTSTSSSASTR